MKALLAVLALLVLAGCGGGEKASLSSADLQHLHRFSVAYEQVANDLVPISDALVDHKLDVARTGMAKLKPELATTVAEARAVQHPATHQALDDVTRATQRTAGSLEKLLATFEANRQPDLDLIGAVGDTTSTMQVMADQFVRRVLAGAPKEQHEAIQAAIYTRE
jgi:hypothetical protein